MEFHFETIHCYIQIVSRPLEMNAFNFFTRIDRVMVILLKFTLINKENVFFKVSFGQIWLKILIFYCFFIINSDSTDILRSQNFIHIGFYFYF